VAHHRTTITAAIKSALTGLTSTASRVYVARPYPLDTNNLPGLFIWLNAEEVEFQSQNDVSYLHSVEIMIEGFAQGATGEAVDTALDSIDEEVRAALLADATVAAAVRHIGYSQMEKEIAGESDKISGKISMTYSARYETARTDPTTDI